MPFEKELKKGFNNLLLFNNQYVAYFHRYVNLFFFFLLYSNSKPHYSVDIASSISIITFQRKRSYSKYFWTFYYYLRLLICNFYQLNQRTHKFSLILAPSKFPISLKNLVRQNFCEVLLVWIYGISTIVGYLKPNPVYPYSIVIYDL